MVHELRNLYDGRLMTGSAFSAPRSSDVGVVTDNPPHFLILVRGEGSSNLGSMRSTGLGGSNVR